MNKRNAKWYRMTPEAVIEQLHTDAACGISPKAARSRLKKYGPNTLFDEPRGSGRTYRRMLIPDSACLLFLGGILLSVLFLPLPVSVLMCALLLLCGVHFFISIKRIKKNEASIAKYRIPDVCVLRGRAKLSVSARTVVPGDILLFRSGDVVPCDCRLLSAHELRVLTLMPDEKGLPVYTELPKNCDAQYAYGELYRAPFCENMLYGGSEILEGSARAVAVETGAFCFLGAMEQFHIPAEKNGGAQKEDALRELRSYLRAYGFLMLALLLPLSVIGVLTAPDVLGIPDIFFPLCLIAGMSSPMLLMLGFRLISLRVSLSCMEQFEEENAVVFKGRGSADKLCCATDLFFVGHGFLSDARLHFHSAALGSSEVGASDTERRGEVYRLCEAFVLLSRASAQKIGLQATNFFTERDTYTSELIRFCKYDTDALDIRLIHASSYKSAEDDTEYVSVEMKNSRFTLLFSSDISRLDGCMQYEDRNGMHPLTEERKKELRAFVRSSCLDACRVTLAMRRLENGSLSLIGIMAARERIPEGTRERIQMLSECGIRPTFFFEGNTAYERAFAEACGVDGGTLVCTDPEDVLEETLLEDYRIFIGFPPAVLSRLLSKLQSKHKRVGVLIGQTRNRYLLKEATFTVAAAFTDLHKKTREDLARSESIDGGEGSFAASAVVRRRADVIAPCINAKGGGLASLTEALLECRTVAKRVLLLLSYLVPSHMLRIFLAVFLTLLGIGLPGALQILYAGFFLDTLVLFMCFRVKFPRETLKRHVRIGEKTVERLVFYRTSWLPVFVAALIFSLLTSILVWTGLADVYAAHTLTFVEMILFELLLLCRIGTSVCDREMRGSFARKLLYWALPVLVLIPLSVLIPPLGEITGLGSWTTATVIALPLLPVLYLASGYFVSFFNRTAK